MIKTVVTELRGALRVSAAVASLLAAPLIAAPAIAQQKTVAAGETWLITSEQKVTLDQLTIGDGARIEFADNVENWALSVKRARIGRDVVIDGRGASGEPGAPGEGFTEPARVCDDGKNGLAGGQGGMGGSGVNLSLSLGIAEIGSLTVATDGGAGGAGGVGGAGQHGGDINKCRGGAGGDGGAGGTGGPGGAAGDLTLVYRPLGSLDTTDILRAMKLSSAGGEGGKGGSGGVGGGGVEGRYMKGSFGGNKKWLAGGEAGAVGDKGASGESGPSRNPIVQLDGAAQSLRAPAVGARVEPTSRLKQLEQRIEALEKRLRALEQKAQP
ncbi:hypothetical protein FHR99_003112 [Litorivivens lipolytica]|uniref:Collagen triple helix repeat-containing protein n=1 Tax=Litorivivens lipolytica TaxID=1524264 RepID=A0A7W4W8B7_9GAMM|nr:hypothetical protein [Litorivivens lipolytica]MBB3048838.1 hypothetical protein [Litorivivens lipolytica]